MVYIVKSNKDLVNVIIPFFDKHPLMTQKWSDFMLFKQIVLMMHKKEHLLEEKFHELLCIKASLNLGLSAKLKEEFPHIIPAPRPIVDPDRAIPHPQ